jgi:hypothetical protein
MKRSWLFGFFVCLAHIALSTMATVVIAVYHAVDWLLDAWPISDDRQVPVESWPADSTLRGPAVSRDRQFHARRLAREDAALYPKSYGSALFG